MFAQSVYLIFASVYMCKETVEHLLLSAGDDQQHHADHHHHSDGYVVSPNFNFITDCRILCRGLLPMILAFLSLAFVVVNALRFDNHAKLVEGPYSPCNASFLTHKVVSYELVTGSQLPQLTSLLPSTRTSFHVPKGKKQQPTPIDTVLSNPFSLSPIAFSLALVFPPFFLPEYVWAVSSSSCWPESGALIPWLIVIKFVHSIYSFRQYKPSSPSAWLTPRRWRSGAFCYKPLPLAVFRAVGWKHSCG